MGRVAVKHSVFALEVCARLVPGSSLVAAFTEVIKSAPERMNLHQKWLQYQRGAELVLENMSVVERGSWDYFNDDGRALSDYEMWTIRRARPPSRYGPPLRTSLAMGEARFPLGADYGKDSPDHPHDNRHGRRRPAPRALPPDGHDPPL
jgi:hypothetical protein